jgi:site-specific recombinase XerD
LRLFATDTAPADPFAATHEDLVAWVERRATTYAARSAYRTCLRLFFTWAVRHSITAENPAAALSAMSHIAGATAPVVRPIGSHGPLPLATPEGWEAIIGQWAREQRACGKTIETMRTQTSHIRRVARAVAPKTPFEVEFYDLVDWMAAQTWARETRRAARAALRSFYGWAVEADLTDLNPADRLPKVTATPPAPRPASEVTVHFAVLTATPRERLMVRLAAEIGLRRAEVAGVHSRDLLEHDEGWSLVVHGKGQRDRVMPLPPELASELRSLAPGWAFPSPAGGHMTPGHVGKKVGQLLPEGVTMHALRHRFATRAYAMTHDILVVQRLLGHSRPETTQRYVKVGDDQLRATVNALAATTTRSAISPAGAA